MASTGTQQAISSVPTFQALPEVSRRRRLEDLGLVLLVGFVPLVVSAIFLLIHPIAFPSGFVNYRFASAIVHEAVTLALFLVLLRRQGRTFQSIGLHFHWKDLGKGLGLCLLSYLGSFVLNYIAQSAYYFWNQSYFRYRDTSSLHAGESAGLFLAYSLAAPFFEEILVRGYLMTELVSVSCPVWVAALASIALQTSYHLYYGWAGAGFVAFGFVVSTLYFARSRKLGPVILSHLFWNLTVTYQYWHR